MRVKFAAQVLSSTTGKGIAEEIGEEASETVNLIFLMDKFFDIMNASNFTKAYHKRKPNLKPFQCLNDSRLMWLETDFVRFFNGWETEVHSLPEKLTKKQRNMMLLSQETMEGLKITALSIAAIIRFMLNKGAKYVLPGRINQDCLEQEFGKHRSLCGSNTNPTVFQYGQSVGKIRLL